MCSMKQKKMVLIKRTLSKRNKTLYRTATQTVTQILLKYQTVTQTSNGYWDTSKKKSENSLPTACLPSSHPFQKLKVVLMWSCLLR